MARASASGAAIETRRGSKGRLLIAKTRRTKRWEGLYAPTASNAPRRGIKPLPQFPKRESTRSCSEDSRCEQPEDDDAAEEPVDVNVELADMERAGAEAEEADNTGESADDQAGQEDLLEEVEQHRETLLDLRDVVIVGGIETVAEREQAVEGAGRFLLERIGGGGFVQEECGERADQHDRDAGDQDDRMRAAVRLRDQVEDAGENLRIKRGVTAERSEERRVGKECRSRWSR